MSLMPVLSTTQAITILGSYVNDDDVSSAPWDFTSLSFVAGDLLVAIIVADTNDIVSGPSGFSILGDSSVDSNIDAPVIAIYTKTAVGTETTLSNAEGLSTVATIAIRRGAAGLAAFADDDNPASVANAIGTTVFVVAGSTKSGTPETITPPTGYTMLQEAVNLSIKTTALHVAFKHRCVANENPGAFTSWSDPAGEITTATFSTPPA